MWKSLQISTLLLNFNFNLAFIDRFIVFFVACFGNFSLHKSEVPNRKVQHMTRVHQPRILFNQKSGWSVGHFFIMATEVLEVLQPQGDVVVKFEALGCAAFEAFKLFVETPFQIHYFIIKFLQNGYISPFAEHSLSFKKTYDCLTGHNYPFDVFSHMWMHNSFFQYIMYDKTRVLNPLLVEGVAIQGKVPL